MPETYEYQHYRFSMSRPIPLLDLKRQYGPIRGEVQEAIERVCESQSFILGPEVEALEQECARYCGCRYGCGVSSGTDALLLVLMVLGIGPGNEVITTPYSFFATAGSIVRLGARPVFVDIERETFNIDVSRIERAITSRTKAIMPVHLFGQCAAVASLVDLSERRKIPLIEDAAQAIGAEYGGKRAGSFGIAGCFSFFPSKNLGAFGDAGLVTTSDPDLANRLRITRVHGSEKKYFHTTVGGNFRIDALQAAILRVKLRHLDQWTTRRQQNASLYRTLFAKHGRDKVSLPVERPGGRHIYNQFVIRVPERDRVRAHLTASGIGSEIYYPLPLHEQECFRSLGYRHGDFPESERASRESLALPIFPELQEEEIAAVVTAVCEAL